MLVLGFAPDALAVSRRNRSSESSRHSETALLAPAGRPSRKARPYKIDGELTRLKAGHPDVRTKVIVTLLPGAELPAEFKRFARADRKLDLIDGLELELPNGLLQQLEARPEIVRVHFDRPVEAHNYRTSVTVGATSVRSSLGLTGAGIGVAVIDSGIAAWHDDLTLGASYTLTTSGGATATSSSVRTYPYGNQRVTKFVDFVNGQTLPYDDNGHGTHVAGIITGNGYDSNGEKAGIAPGASLVVLKVLNELGEGRISNVIAAMTWIASNASSYNIRVVNLSVGARITESYWTDPLTLAARKLADKGITVVTAAGNLGRAENGRQQYGSITAPGNAPWVLTVGATSTMGTMTRADDVMASFSSAGPTDIDYLAKPDVVAPGVGTVSLASTDSYLAQQKPGSLVDGAVRAGAYLSLSGTSMASPVVAGTVALMLQANPSLTPNLIKAILQYTAQPFAGYKPLQQGAGFLNTIDAVRLARFHRANVVGAKLPVQASWSRNIIWGNRLIAGGYLNPRANAFANNVIWGSARTAAGDNVAWGALCGDCDDIVWGNADANGANVVWGTSTSDNSVWGMTADDNVVWGTGAEENIVWGTSGDAENIVWGTDCGGGDCDNIVWGTVGDDNVVWGTAGTDDNIVWGTSHDENVVWGTSGSDSVVWGSSDGQVPDVMFPDSADEPVADIDQELRQLSPDLFDLVGGGV